MYVTVPTLLVLIVAGFHVPVILSSDVPGRAGAILPWQRGPIWLNVGVTGGPSTIPLIVICIDAPVAHCPCAGVKLYVKDPAVDVLITDGLHVPLIPLLESSGSEGAVVF